MKDAWSARRYDENARFVSDLGRGVVEWLKPKPGERILDVGCGDGALTEQLVEAGADVLGVDASIDMVDAARARGLDIEVADCHELEYFNEFDAVFSNAALHWMTRPDAVLAGVANALKPGGRFVGEFGGHGNVAAIRTALSAVIKQHANISNAPDTVWFFPSAKEYQSRLEATGFTVERIALIPRPTPIPGEMTAWFETLAAPVLECVPTAKRTAIREEASALLRSVLCDSEGNWTADYVRLRFEARSSSKARCFV